MGRGKDFDGCVYGHDWENVLFEDLVFDDDTMTSEVCQVLLSRCRACGEWRDE